MMELKDFVKRTIVQIVEGVKAAQEATKEAGAEVNPEGLRYISTEDNKEGRRYSDLGYFTEDIQFDVAIAASEGTETKGGIGVFMGPVLLGSQGKSDAGNSTVSRIKFTVPVRLPNG